MSSGDDYRRKAAICFAFAEYTKDPRLRAELHALAKAWVRLAEEAGRGHLVPLRTQDEREHG